jgi:hypothetical protein
MLGILDSGFWILDAGCSMLDARCWMLVSVLRLHAQHPVVTDVRYTDCRMAVSAVSAVFGGCDLQTGGDAHPSIRPPKLRT